MKKVTWSSYLGFRTKDIGKVFVRNYTHNYGGTELVGVKGEIVARSASYSGLDFHAREYCKRHGIKGYTNIKGKFVSVD